MSKKKSLDELKNQIKEEIKAATPTDADFELFKKNMQQTMYYFTEDDKFVGTLLQELNFKMSMQLPTAAMTYNKTTKTFEAYFNPLFFNKWELEERKGILKHEIMHFTHDHLRRFDFGDKENRQLYNIAADMSINQYIKALPPGGVNVADFKMDDGTPFPKYRTCDDYIALLKANPNAQKEMQKKYGGEDGRGEHADSHDWDQLSEEEKKEMAEEMKTLIKRTMEKTQYDLSRVPGGIKDLLKQIDTYLDQFNAKKILEQAIKKNASSADRSNTWKRPNKRYGTYAPGTTLGKIPKLVIYQDTSGSRSTTELNMDRKIIDQFLKSGTRYCDLALWHTEMYHKKRHRLNQEFNASDYQSGGTTINCVINDINKIQPDLSIILTDGYYDWNGIKPTSEVIFCIVDNGVEKHPMSSFIKTITIKNLKNN